MRWLTGFLLILLTAPAGAIAAEPVCTVTGPQARAAATLREEVRVRRQYGFRADEAYVAKLIAAGPPSRSYGIRVTPAEDRYLDRREKLGSARRRARTYAGAQRSWTSGRCATTGRAGRTWRCS